MISRYENWFAVDVQTNGGLMEEETDGNLSVNFSAEGSRPGEAGVTVDQCCSYTRRVRNLGTGVYFPTFVTNLHATLLSDLRVVNRFMTTTDEGKHAPGIHMEACYFLPVPGYIGAHPKEHCVTGRATADLYKSWQSAAGGNIKLITVGANVPGIETVIKAAVEDGCVVSLGHFGPEDPIDPAQVESVIDDIKRAVDAGATMSTHVGNGTKPALHRHGGHILAQLANPNLTPSIITDGSHLPEEFIRMVLAMKGTNTILVSDAAPEEGSPPGPYQSWAGEVEVVEHTVKIGQYEIETCKIAPPGEPNLLAASWATLPACVRIMAKLLMTWGCDVTDTTSITLNDLAEMTCDNVLDRFGLKASDYESLPGQKFNFENFVLG